jgi:hypothetical protein
MKFIITTFISLYVAMMPIDAYAGNGTATITSDQPASNIYVNGKLVAMTGDDKASVKVSLSEGEHVIKVQKDTLQWTYAQLRRVYIGSNVDINLTFELQKHPSEFRFERLEKQAKGHVDLRESEKIAKTDDRYTDHGDGTVTDKATGLMWMKCAYGLSGSDCSIGEGFSTMSVDSTHCNEENSRREMDTSECYEPLATAKDVVDAVNKDNFAGYNDWRMPAVDELHSLVKCPKGRRDVNRNVILDEIFQIKDLQKRGMKLTASITSDPETTRYFVDEGGRVNVNNGMCRDRSEERTINKNIFPSTPYKLWSSSEQAHREGQYWNIYFASGADSARGLQVRSAFIKLTRVAKDNDRALKELGLERNKALNEMNLDKDKALKEFRRRIEVAQAGPIIQSEWEVFGEVDPASNKKIGTKAYIRQSNDGLCSVMVLHLLEGIRLTGFQCSFKFLIRQHFNNNKIGIKFSDNNTLHIMHLNSFDDEQGPIVNAVYVDPNGEPLNIFTAENYDLNAYSYEDFINGLNSAKTLAIKITPAMDHESGHLALDPVWITFSLNGAKEAISKLGKEL